MRCRVAAAECQDAELAAVIRRTTVRAGKGVHLICFLTDLRAGSTTCRGSRARLDGPHASRARAFRCNSLDGKSARAAQPRFRKFWPPAKGTKCFWLKELCCARVLGGSPSKSAAAERFRGVAGRESVRKTAKLPNAEIIWRLENEAGLRLQRPPQDPPWIGLKRANPPRKPKAQSQ